MSRSCSSHFQRGGLPLGTRPPSSLPSRRTARSLVLGTRRPGLEAVSLGTPTGSLRPADSRRDTTGKGITPSWPTRTRAPPPPQEPTGGPTLEIRRRRLRSGLGGDEDILRLVRGPGQSQVAVLAAVRERPPLGTPPQHATSHPKRMREEHVGRASVDRRQLCTRKPVVEPRPVMAAAMAGRDKGRNSNKGRPGWQG